MIRENRFVMSHRPYAVDLERLSVSTSNQAKVGAVWFRRRRGVTVACVGYLWDFQTPAPSTAAEFVQRHTDGRYGGTTLGRWDGERYWGAEEPEVIEAHLRLLRPMLASFPAVPESYDGWWCFR